jgi:hypothetical protein
LDCFKEYWFLDEKKSRDPLFRNQENGASVDGAPIINEQVIVIIFKKKIPNFPSKLASSFDFLRCTRDCPEYADCSPSASIGIRKLRNRITLFFDFILFHRENSTTDSKSLQNLFGLKDCER